MKRKYALLWLTSLLLVSQVKAQEKPTMFFTVGMRVERTPIQETKEEKESLPSQEDPTEEPKADSASTKANAFSNLSVEELEKMIAKYEEKSSAKKSESKRILSFYDGQSHELTLNNLIDVVGECGLSNQLFVLAQALLETGNFSSNVCKNYHNLFGLYDSRHHEYYRFERWEDSVIGYQRFIQYRYKGGNYLSFLRRIGYAEDPRYINKVAKMARKLYQTLFAS